MTLRQLADLKAGQRASLFLPAVIFLLAVLSARLAFAENAPIAAGGTNASPHFKVEAYVIGGIPLPVTNNLPSLFSKHTGSNVSLTEIVKAAAEVQAEYANQGFPSVSIAIAQSQITNGVVTLHVFQGALAQILVSGRHYTSSGEELAPVTNPMVGEPAAAAKPVVAAASTNAAPAATNVLHFSVKEYDIMGNTLLSPKTLGTIFSKHTGTNITRDDFLAAVKELQLEYHDRGYDTVSVTVPQQSLTNGIFKIRVFEGRLAEILVSKNHYFSSNNIMSSLPGLRTNMMLNSKLFQPELDRANANQDRQIYPRIKPGPEPNTTTLQLDVKDRLPLHAKVELNNQSSPGTPELRVNTSAVYDNLWQLNHSLGVQYSFSPEQYKQGSQWDFYDQPLVANYSTFYRLPLGNPGSIEEEVAARPGTFGYDEATRKFNLPPPSGVPELNLYANRSTIDTGLELPTPDVLLQTSARTITKGTSQEDLTVNNGLGFRLSAPVPEFDSIRSVISGGFDYKQYDLKSDKSFIYQFIEILHHSPGDAGTTQTGTLLSPVPPTDRPVHYLPMTVRWDGARMDDSGRFDFGLSYSPNFIGGLFSGSKSNFQNAAGSTKASGFYHIVNASLTRDQALFKQWRLNLHLEGQWANQPLISNEQFGDGGVAGVRGYREGEVFGDTGWRMTSELKTPAHVVGLVGGPKNPLTIRGSLFMDYGETFLLDPQGRDARTPLWGTGVGFVVTVGPDWQGRFMFAFPLEDTATSEAGQPRFTFGLTAQF